MATSQKKAGFIQEIEKQLTEELKASRQKDKEGNYVMPSIERMRVVDRCLKLEAIKAKMGEAEYGSGFSDD